jgi:uncharacterized membrane protein
MTRLEAFSDAVFAFSATLLVVSLEVPETFSDLLAVLNGFIPFALSFTTLVVLWTIHNAYFRRYDLDDGWTVFLNSCLLFVVLFYVYPLKFVARGIVATFLQPSNMPAATGIHGSGELSQLFVLYGLGFMAVFACVAALYWHAWRRRARLQLTVPQAAEAAALARHYAIFVVVGLLSVTLAASEVGLRVGLPGWIYVVLGPLCGAHAYASERYARRLSLTGERSDAEAAPLVSGRPNRPIV